MAESRSDIALTSCRISFAYSGGAYTWGIPPAIWRQVVWRPLSSWLLTNQTTQHLVQQPTTRQPSPPSTHCPGPQNHGASEWLALSNARLNGFWAIWTAIFLFILILTPCYISFSSLFLAKMTPKSTKNQSKVFASWHLGFDVILLPTFNAFTFDSYIDWTFKIWKTLCF